MPRLLTLEEACAHLNGALKPRAIRRLIHQGRLPVIVIARRFFVTPESLDAMIVNATLTMSKPCPAADFPRASSSAAPDRTKDSDPPGSLSMERVRLARAQALMSLEKLKKPSSDTSPKTTGRLSAPIVPISSSVRKS
jgi:hypothetical protein